MELKFFIASHGVRSGEEEEESELELGIKNLWQIFISNLRSAEKVLFVLFFCSITTM